MPVIVADSSTLVKLEHLVTNNGAAHSVPCTGDPCITTGSPCQFDPGFCLFGFGFSSFYPLVFPILLVQVKIEQMGKLEEFPN